MKKVGLEAEETFIQSPTIYIPSSPDYARAVSSGIAWGLIPEAQCAEELESGHLVNLATTPVEFPLYWQRWNINSPVHGDRNQARPRSGTRRPNLLKGSLVHDAKLNSKY